MMSIGKRLDLSQDAAFAASTIPRKRTEVQDASATPHHLLTALTPVQEAVCLKERTAPPETVIGKAQFEHR